MYRVNKVISVMLAFVFVFYTTPFVFANTADGIVTKYAIVMSAPYQNFVFQNTHDSMVDLFESYNITTFDHEQPEGYGVYYFLNAISNYLSQSDSDDIVYVYINSHGNYDSTINMSYLAVGGN